MEINSNFESQAKETTEISFYKTVKIISLGVP